MWRDSLTTAAVLGRDENYRTISYGKSTPLLRRSDVMHRAKHRLGHNRYNEAAERVIATMQLPYCRLSHRRTN